MWVWISWEMCVIAVISISKYLTDYDTLCVRRIIITNDVWCWLRITDWETDYYHHNNHYISHPQCGCGVWWFIENFTSKIFAIQKYKRFLWPKFSRCKIVLAHYIFFTTDKIWWCGCGPRVPIISKYLTWVKFLLVQTAQHCIRQTGRVPGAVVIIVIMLTNIS